MAERITKQQRLTMQSVAEREVMKYSRDHALWHKYVHNVDLDPMQILKCIEMDEHPATIDVSCRRSRKTSTKELRNLKILATEADQELGIVAPRLQQAMVNLRYMTDAVDRSPILQNYLHYRNGRQQKSETKLQFANRSIAQPYGIYSQIDGGDLTMVSLEETDDMPRDRLMNNLMPMLAGTQRLGAANNGGAPQIRITGVYKGADTLQEMIDSGEYTLLPKVNRYLAEQLGIVHGEHYDKLANEMSPNEYLRQALCINVVGADFIHEKALRFAMMVSLKADMQFSPPVVNGEYRKRGTVSLGYDAGGHGEQEHSSQHAVVITEQVDGWTWFPFFMTWPASTDEITVQRDLVAIWKYFRPDVGIGDAYGVGMITAANDELFKKQLIQIDRRTVNDGDSTASAWANWGFKPMRFDGMAKHQMADALRNVFHRKRAIFPYFDDSDSSDSLKDLRRAYRQFLNIEKLSTSKGYASYSMIKPAIGDDLFDAAMAANWGLFTQGAQMPEIVVLQDVRQESEYFLV